MKTKNNKDKQTLIKEHILTSTQIQLNQLSLNCQQLDEQILSMRKNLRSTIRQLLGKFQQYKNHMSKQLQKYGDMLMLQDQQLKQQPQQSSNNSQLVKIKLLAKYLQAQKNELKSLLAQEGQSKSQTTDKLHQILSKKKIENILIKVQKRSLEQQIKFLETNILIGKPGKFILNYDVEAPLQQEQTRIQNEIKKQIEELQRVVSLSIICNKSNQSQSKTKIQTLQAQTKRLLQAKRIVQNQKNYFKKIQLDLKSYENIVSEVPLIYIEDPTDVNFLQNKAEQARIQNIDMQELNQLQNFQVIQNLSYQNQNLQKVFENTIINCKKKLRKIQNWTK